MSEYQSSVLTCNVAEDECAVCRFLNGDQSKEVMLEVIRVLDAKLAETQENFEAFVHSYR